MISDQNINQLVGCQLSLVEFLTDHCSLTTGTHKGSGTSKALVPEYRNERLECLKLS